MRTVLLAVVAGLLALSFCSIDAEACGWRLRARSRFRFFGGDGAKAFCADGLRDANVEEKKDVIYGQGFQTQVATGDETKALAYYKNVLTKDTGFNTDPRPALDDLLKYFGYSLSGEDLEKDDPDAIMKGF